MIDKLIEGLYNFLFGLVGTFTGPISNIVNANFPDLSNVISTVTGFINSLSSLFAYFMYLVPPLSRVVLLAFLAVVIMVYPGMIAIELLGKSLDLIKRVWPFGGK